MLNLGDLFDRQSIWLQGTGADSDIVISSRIRLARNINGFSFVNRASKNELEAILNKVHEMADKYLEPNSIYFIELDKIGVLDRYCLVERQLISNELAEADRPRAVLVDKKENFSVMVNEEDHLRIQVMDSGFEFRNLWKRIDHLDDVLGKGYSVAFDERWGYLTACPSNVGTGIRVSVMIHIPGLVETEEAERVFCGLQKIGLAVRGMYGEGSNALGDFFQISNQTTLGHCEEEIIEQMYEVIPRVLEYERKAREWLLLNCRERLLDKCFRAMALLKTAHTISLEEAMEHLSSVRLGIHLNLIENVSCSGINDILLHAQPAHITHYAGKNLNSEEENIARADYFRNYFVKKEKKD